MTEPRCLRCNGDSVRMISCPDNEVGCGVLHLFACPCNNEPQPCEIIEGDDHCEHWFVEGGICCWCD